MASFWSAHGDNLNQTSESWHMSVFFFLRVSSSMDIQKNTCMLSRLFPFPVYSCFSFSRLSIVYIDWELNTVFSLVIGVKYSFDPVKSICFLYLILLISSFWQRFRERHIISMSVIIMSMISTPVMASKRMIHTDLLAFDVPGGDSGTGKERRDIISCWEKDLVFMSGCFLREAFIVGCFVTFKKVLFLSQFILIKKISSYFSAIRKV